MSEKHNFTVREFYDQVAEFRQMFGTKSFWALPEEKREKAQDALSYAYFFLDGNIPKQELNHCAFLLQTTLSEYMARERMLMMSGVQLGK